MEVSALTHPSSIPGLRGPTALLRLQSDERLITLTRRGQHAAFEVLCARYQSRLLSFCRHMLSSREDAEDVLQEVYAAAFNAVLADEREINVRPWLYRIARNRSLNHLRRATAVGVDSMDVHYAENGVSTGDKVMRRESFRELIADVQQLPETQRTALLLREIDALSYEQIAHAMETTVPSVKSLLVRARISLAEAAEARKLSCEQVRLELGEVAEGLAKLSTPARRHTRDCERCTFFRKQLKENNHALALIMPVGPLLLVKKLLLAKLGTTASAGGAHVAGGATVGAGATASASASAGAAAAGGGGMAGGIMTAGAGALATKAVAGLAAAAIVTAGAVAADHAVVAHPHRHPLAAATASVPAGGSAGEPVVVHQALQPISSTPAPLTQRAGAAAQRARRRHQRPSKPPKTTPALAPQATSATPAAPVAAGSTTTATTPPVKPAAPPAVTEVTTQTTELPASATSVPGTTPPSQTTTTTGPSSTQPVAGSTSPTTGTTTTTTPPATTPAEPAPTTTVTTPDTTTTQTAAPGDTTAAPPPPVTTPSDADRTAPASPGLGEAVRSLRHTFLARSTRRDGRR
jgi:RNA polymerase sigma factor (sigma-70 family)